MADDGVKIPVIVTGAEVAQQKLGQVGQAVENLGQTEQAHAAGSKKAGDAASAEASQLENLQQEVVQLKAKLEELRKEQDKNDDAGGKNKKGHEETAQSAEVHRKAEVALKSILAEINPELARSADLLFDLFEGATKLTPALFAIGGAGAALGGLVWIFQAMSEAARKTHEEIERIVVARKELAGERLSADMDLMQQLMKAGVSPAKLATATQTRDSLIKQVGLDFANSAAVAQAVGDLSPEQVQEYLAGLVQGGGQPPQMPDTISGRRALIDQVRRAGQSTEAKEALRQYKAAGAPAFAGQALPEQTPERQREQAVGAVLADPRLKEDYNEAELKLMREAILWGWANEKEGEKHLYDWLSWGQKWWVGSEKDKDALGLHGQFMERLRARELPGMSHNIGEIMDKARTLQPGVDQMQNVMGSQSGQVVNYNVQNYNYNTNIHTMIQPPDPFLAPPAHGVEVGRPGGRQP